MHVILRILQTAQALDKAAQRIFAPHGLTAAQFNVLNLLAAKGDGLCASDLATGLIVDPSNVTGLLRRMTRDGLVADRENRADRRQRIVGLTPKGRKIWARAAEDYEKCLTQLDAIFTTKEKSVTETVLIRVGDESSTVQP